MTLILLNWSVVKLFIKPVVLHFLLSFLDAFYSHFLRTLFIGIGVGCFISVWVEMYWHFWIVLIAGWRNFSNIFSFSFSIMVGYISIIEKLCLIELFCCYSFNSLLFFCNYTYFHTHPSLPLFVFSLLIIFTHSHLYTSPPFVHNSLNIFHSIGFYLFQSNVLKSSINILFNLFELDIVSLYIVAIRQVYSIYYF